MASKKVYFLTFLAGPNIFIYEKRLSPRRRMTVVCLVKVPGLIYLLEWIYKPLIWTVTVG